MKRVLPTTPAALMKTALVSWMLLFASALNAAAAARTGEVTQLFGTLSVAKANGVVKLVAVQAEVESGDTLTTGSDSYARLRFSDGGELALRPNSRIKIDSYAFDKNNPRRDNFLFSLLKGGLRAVTGLIGHRPDRYQLRTPVAVIGIRGTIFDALLCQADCGGLLRNPNPEDGLYLGTEEGVISPKNRGGTNFLGPGEFGFTSSFEVRTQLLSADPGLSFDLPTPDSTRSADDRATKRLPKLTRECELGVE
ncbi:MAG: FecR family protein [Burkholderiales bacterium]